MEEVNGVSSMRCDVRCCVDDVVDDKQLAHTGYVCERVGVTVCTCVKGVLYCVMLCRRCVTCTDSVYVV